MTIPLRGRTAFITGASRGIGKAIALRLAAEGSDVVVTGKTVEPHRTLPGTIYTAAEEIRTAGGSAIAIPMDVRDEAQVEAAVTRAIDDFGRIDILVNNAGEQHPDQDITDISEEQLRRTFQTNIFGMFFLTQAVRPHLAAGSAIINCTSVTSFQGSKELLDYSSTKGAITSFTRSLSENLVGDGIRVNGVAPGPIWTPLNPCGGASREKLEHFGESTPMGRPGQPNEVAPSFLFLACDDSSYMSGQILHPNGGIVVGG